MVFIFSHLYFYIFLAILSVSFISLIGALILSLNREWLKKTLFILVSFATGSLLGAAFLDLLPEALENCEKNIFVMTLVGILSFFIIEKFIHWHHHHTGEHDIHPFTYMNLIGDGFHNFIDGIAIAASFSHDIRLGIATSIAILFHEIPQEIGDFGILLYGGFSKGRALFFNFLASLTSFLGAFVGVFFLSQDISILPYLLAFAAGNFIYIASTDLLPELKEHSKSSTSLIQLIAILMGVFTIAFIT
ncbi:MAG: ZIP family metal transporter [Deltaproteobacteria bacterium]|nr:ZIP family metal transporter [Deltaproteobacteria bacterium]